MGVRARKGTSPRSHQRHLTEGLTCVTGDVLDLSPGGMRVRSNERPPCKVGGASAFTLCVGPKTLTVQGRVAWIKRASLLSGPYEYGIQFIGITGAVAKVLDQIARYGFVHDGKDAPKATSDDQHWANAYARSPGCDDGVARKVTVTADLPCFYEAIGVSRDATQDEIKAAYRTLAKRLHPDVCKEPDAADRFAFITRVHEVLSDSELRARYDEAIARRAAAA